MERSRIKQLNSAHLIRLNRNGILVCLDLIADKRCAFGLLADQVRGDGREVTGAKAIGLVGDQNRLVRRAAVCAGSCGKIINSVIAAKADLYLTGELKHHQALAAQEAGLTCICLSHTVSERFILKKFARQLQKQIKTIKIRISKKDTDPFKWKNI